MQNLGFLLAIVNVIFYGCADYVGSEANQRTNRIAAVLIFQQSLGLGLFLFVAAVRRDAVLTITQILAAMGGGIFGLIGLRALYQALSFGAAAVTPITGLVDTFLGIGFGLL